ncbi:hypothetical protein TSUD_140630 [Trifolium subterraneum]|uniref:Uncharacterized protein n=1 Tax=Trifolium subterraneum TaxID=3900 RepID=A0A2Z6NZ37_TRISU|nr:hypothetical protein TSUD_140630 [Trifolium subterraneum]
MRERGEGASDHHHRDGYRHNQRWPPRRSSSPFERNHGGEGPYAREAHIGRDQGDWTWVSRRRRKASRPGWNGQDGFWQDIGFDGRIEFQNDDRFGMVSYHATANGYFGDSRDRRSRSMVRAWDDGEHGRGHSFTRRGNWHVLSTDVVGQVGNDSNTLKAMDSVVFYISNFPEHFLFVDLKKGVEVCGIMEDIYVSRYRNKFGQRFGFVKYLKVRDIFKLKKALNNLYFWDLKLFANVAKYDRFVSENKGEIKGEGKVRHKHIGGVENSREGDESLGEWRKKELERVKREAICSEEARWKPKEVVIGVENDVRKKEVVEETEVKAEKDGTPVIGLPWKYLSLKEDVVWASQCFLAKLKDGLCLSMVQQALTDAGFEDIKIIPLGGDNVLLHPAGQGTIDSLLQSTTDLVGNFLEGFIPWSREADRSYVRGAWVRCYGIPVHAWNPIFFAELAETQGRLLKIEESTVNRERMDFASILIATSSVKEINVTIKVLIDNVMTDIHIIEDVGFGLASDACLLEIEEDNNSQFSSHTGMPEAAPLVDDFVQKLHDDWVNNVVVDKMEESNTVNQAIPSSPTSQPKQASKEKIIKPPSVGIVKEQAQVKQKISKEGGRKQQSKRRILILTVYGLKKIARLSETERNALIRSLKKAKRQKGASSSGKVTSQGKNCTSLSVGSGATAGATNSQDWNNWVALHKCENQVKEDVQEMGEKLGIKCHNSFQRERGWVCDEEVARVGSGEAVVRVGRGGKF